MHIWTIWIKIRIYEPCWPPPPSWPPPSFPDLRFLRSENLRDWTAGGEIFGSFGAILRGKLFKTWSFGGLDEGPGKEGVISYTKGGKPAAGGKFCDFGSLKRDFTRGERSKMGSKKILTGTSADPPLVFRDMAKKGGGQQGSYVLIPIQSLMIFLVSNLSKIVLGLTFRVERPTL